MVVSPVGRQGHAGECHDRPGILAGRGGQDITAGPNDAYNDIVHIRRLRRWGRRVRRINRYRNRMSLPAVERPGVDLSGRRKIAGEASSERDGAAGRHLLDRSVDDRPIDDRLPGINIIAIEVQGRTRGNDERIDIKSLGAGARGVLSVVDELDISAAGQFNSPIGEVVDESGRDVAEILAHHLQRLVSAIEPIPFTIRVPWELKRSTSCVEPVRPPATSRVARLLELM